MRSISTKITDLLNIDFPIIMAPMYLITNEDMMIAAMNSGIAACMPALNWNSDEDMRMGIKKIKQNTEKGSLGINLMINNSTQQLEKQIQTCLDLKVDFIITSLGNPEKIIKACKKSEIKIFCKLTDEKFAKKIVELGAHALIAVNKEAGGCSGSLAANELIPLLKKKVDVPIISAGGIGEGKGFYNRMIKDGADACSIGSVFIASTEAKITEEYKNACIKYSNKDIVNSFKFSDFPLTLINTDFVKRMGIKQSFFKKILSKNKFLKKTIRKRALLNLILILKTATTQKTYKNVWIAGSSIKYISSIQSTEDIINSLTNTYIRFEKEKLKMARCISRES